MVYFALIRCDLLEKSYLCNIRNNRYVELPFQRAVVICSKNRIFAI